MKIVPQEAIQQRTTEQIVEMSKFHRLISKKEF